MEIIRNEANDSLIVDFENKADLSMGEFALLEKMSRGIDLKGITYRNINLKGFLSNFTLKEDLKIIRNQWYNTGNAIQAFKILDELVGKD